jgi:hypothetical protein
MYSIVPESRSWHQFERGVPALADQSGDLSLSHREIRAGDRVLADPKLHKRLNATEVIECDWEGIRCWVDRRLFERFAHPAN